MSIDNNAVLFVGLPFHELNPDEIFDEPDDLIIPFNDESLGYYSTNDYQKVGDLVGYLIEDSGSYGLKVIHFANLKIANAIADFEKHFNKEPKVYLFNRQS